MNTLRVLLIDRASPLRNGLAQLIAREPAFEMVGEVDTVADAERLAPSLSPDLIVAELELSDDGDTAGVSRLRAAFVRARVLAFSHLDSARDIRAALRHGARGYIVKHGTKLAFLAGLRAVASGERHLCAVATARLRASRPTNGGVGNPETAATSRRGITSREREVLTMIASGQCNKRMAAKLQLSVKTVEKHRANLMRKLELHNVADLTRFALRNDLVVTPAGSINAVNAAVRWVPPAATTAPVPACAASSCACPHRYYLDRRRLGHRRIGTGACASSLGIQERRSPAYGRRAADH